MSTIRWAHQTTTVEMLDQRALPSYKAIVICHSTEDVVWAIKEMVIRGAPALGIAAAYGLALASERSRAVTIDRLYRDLSKAAADLFNARPTAINIRWALERMLRVFIKNESLSIRGLKAVMLNEAIHIALEDVEACRQMGEHGAKLIKDGDTILHHCNTGALVAAGYGTALGVIRTAHEQGKEIHVIVDETRPRLQGSRLTAWELERYGIPYSIIVDGAAGSFMQRGLIDMVFVGADRITANGDVVNKIGTYMLALAAYHNSIPFYCVAPLSTIDKEIHLGMDVPIEERPPDEVLELEWNGSRASPEASTARNPAFDVTPASKVSGIVTEIGMLYPPYSRTIGGAFKKGYTKKTGWLALRKQMRGG